MVVIISEKAGKEETKKTLGALAGAGLVFRMEKIGEKKALIIEGSPSEKLRKKIEKMPFVEWILDQNKSYFLASSDLRGTWKSFELGKSPWKSSEFLVAAGPCAVEDEKTLDAAARAVKKAGGRILRGGSFKPRTSPYSFQGLGEEGLRIHRKVSDKHRLLMMTEVLDREDLPLVGEIADVIQVGSRNMQNFPLLKNLGKFGKPVLLKRGFGSTREEFLLAAEYILNSGNEKVILCERGVRGFDPACKHVLDLASIMKLREMTWLPIVVDPSHSAGDSRFVPVLAKSALIAGADGLLIEVHPSPGRALSDGQQALDLMGFEALSAELEKLCALCGKRFGA